MTTGRMEELYRAHGPALLAYLRRQVRGAAEDLLQETFVRVLGGTNGLAHAASERAWLFGIARNVAREARRDRRGRALVGDVAAVDAGEDDEPLTRMREAIARLPDGQREALELRLSEDLSYEEIAQVLEIPIGTVRSRLHHAVRSLRDALKEPPDER